MSCPVETIRKVFDVSLLTIDHIMMFDQIQYSPYSVIIVKTESSCPEMVTVLSGDSPISLIVQYLDTDTYASLYVRNELNDSILENLQYFIPEQIRILEILEIRKYPDYFPHYSSEFLSRYNPYQILDKLQGKNGIYYTGAWTSSELVEPVTEQSLKVVNMVKKSITGLKK